MNEETFYYFLIITYPSLSISQTIYAAVAFPEQIKKSLFRQINMRIRTADKRNECGFAASYLRLIFYYCYVADYNIHSVNYYLI